MQSVLLIAGGSCSGKTTLARQLRLAAAPGEVAELSIDSYYHDQSGRTLEERARVNYDHPDAIDGELVVRDVEALVRGQAVAVPVYDFRTHARLPETVRVEPAPILVVEGLFALWFERLQPFASLGIYVAADGDTRLMRRLRRDIVRGRTVDQVLAQYEASVKAMHEQYVEPSRAHADLIVPGNRPFDRIIPLLLHAARA